MSPKDIKDLIGMDVETASALVKDSDKNVAVLEYGTILNKNIPSDVIVLLVKDNKVKQIIQN